MIRRQWIKSSGVALSLGMLLVACGTKPKSEQTGAGEPAAVHILSVTSKPFGETKDGKKVTLYAMKNQKGMEVSVMNYGGIIVSILAPNKKRVLEDVTLGYDSFPDYENKNQYFGALIGRYGNRIAKAKFTLDGKTYALAANDGVNHLHGGRKGFDKVFWNIAVVSSVENPSIKLTYLSPDGEEGYPGNLNVEVVYTLTEDNELRIEYEATSDKKTVINLTQHTYFNLTGNVKGDILDHQLKIAADRFLPVDKTLIPTGQLLAVAGTPFDFNVSTSIGSRIMDKNDQLKAGLGYDHCWIFKNSSDSLKKVATVSEPISGRQMEVFTTEPAIQFYSGNFLNEKIIGKNGTVYNKRTGLCLETQHYPDSPNKPSFPSVVLEPQKEYRSTTVYKFSAY